MPDTIPTSQPELDTLIQNEQQLRKEIAALKRQEESLKEMDEKIKHNIEVIHQERIEKTTASYLLLS
ncbi:hypothetical protein CU098_013215 [Rhizopus stolonifer]|uniref:Uncharacterized protein n=1 Tax=Rhizopus stolonifer TaxID=4846 RepID=A0A367KV51_RHIST|nr:hypothetical protein CU098_013215 [Rhizopus stolonifer]